MSINKNVVLSLLLISLLALAVSSQTKSKSTISVELSSLSVLSISGTKAIFEFIIENKLGVNLTNVSWTFDAKDGNVINSTAANILQPNEQMFVYVDYNFTTAGTYNVNAGARNGTLVDYGNLTVVIN